MSVHTKKRTVAVIADYNGKVHCTCGNTFTLEDYPRANVVVDCPVCQHRHSVTVNRDANGDISDSEDGSGSV